MIADTTTTRQAPASLPPLCQRGRELLFTFARRGFDLDSLITDPNFTPSDWDLLTTDHALQLHLQRTLDLAKLTTTLRAASARVTSINELELVAKRTTDLIEKRRAANALFRATAAPLIADPRPPRSRQDRDDDPYDPHDPANPAPSRGQDSPAQPAHFPERSGSVAASSPTQPAPPTTNSHPRHPHTSPDRHPAPAQGDNGTPSAAAPRGQDTGSHPQPQSTSISPTPPTPSVASVPSALLDPSTTTAAPSPHAAHPTARSGAPP